MNAEDNPDVCRHDWHRMHHYGDYGPDGPIRYCPTGFDSCSLCPTDRHTPEGEEECTKWGTA